jgi:hypothetical protein
VTIPAYFTPPTQLMAWAIYVLLVLIVVDTVVGIGKSLASGVFHLSLIANFLKTAVVPLVLPLMGLYLLAVVIPQTQALALSAAGAAVVKMLSDIGAKLGINLGQVAAVIAGALGVSAAKPAPALAPTPPKQG